MQSSTSPQFSRELLARFGCDVHEHSLGVPRTFTTAVGWFERVAEQGEAMAMAMAMAMRSLSLLLERRP